MLPTTNSFHAFCSRRFTGSIRGALVASLLLLAACGSGGSDAEATDTTTTGALTRPVR